MEKKKGLVLGGLLLLGIGFAAVSTTLYLNGDVNISANEEDFDVKFTKAVIDNEDRTSTVISEDGKTITYTTKELQALNDKSVLVFEITNNSSLYDAEVSIECTSGEKGEYYQITKEVASSIAAKTTDKGKVEVQKIKMVEEDIEEAFTCTLTAKALERTTKGEATLGVNKNIVNSDIECLKNKEAGSCAPGTEIRYMVNDTTEKIFYVLHDDGEAMTLINNETHRSMWSDYNDSGLLLNNGPEYVLETAENLTSNWANVNLMNYSLGDDTSSLGYSTCETYDICSKSSYKMSRSNVRGRIATVQEMTNIGCTDQEFSCPNWLNLDEYLWLMNTSNTSNIYNGSIWSVKMPYEGEGYSLGYSGAIPSDTLAVRVVIEINK